jgi:ribosomal protein S18 acetylase RimI-like enzyme
MPPPQTIVRPAQPEDVDSIVAFSAAMALETEGRQLDQTRLRKGTQSLFGSPELGYFLVAEHSRAGGAQLIGQLMITYEWSDWRNAVFWWIQSVYVPPAWRRQGVYRLMHDTIAARAKADPKVCGIRLYVRHTNHTAQSVYQRVGLLPSAYTVYEYDFVLVHPQSAPPNNNV